MFVSYYYHVRVCVHAQERAKHWGKKNIEGTKIKE